MDFVIKYTYILQRFMLLQKMYVKYLFNCVVAIALFGQSYSYDIIIL